METYSIDKHRSTIYTFSGGRVCFLLEQDIYFQTKQKLDYCFFFGYEKLNYCWFDV
jgi:hypothetical protein